MEPCVEGDAHRDRLISSLALNNAGSDPAFTRLARLAASATRSAAAVVSFFGGNGHWIRAREGCDPAKTATIEALCLRCLQTGTLVEVPDIACDAQVDWSSANGGGASPFASYAGHPIVFDGLVLGVVSILDGHPRALDAGCRATLEDLAGMARDLLLQRHWSTKLQEEQLLSGRLACRLERSEERSAMAQRVARIGTWELEAGSMKPRFSAGISTLLALDGASDLESLEDFARWVHPEDVARFRAISRAGECQAGHTQDDFRIVRPDGEWRWLFAACETHCAQDGAAIRHSCVVQDVTDRKAIEVELKQSEERYRLLWQVTTDVVLLVDEHNTIQFANPAIEAMFGHAPSDVLMKDLAIVQPERLVRPHREGFARYLASGHKRVDWHAFETVGLHRDGHEFPIEIAYGVMHTGGRRLFAAFIRDITSRKQQARALERSEARFKALAALSSDWYWETDSDFRLTRVFGGSSPGHEFAVQSLLGKVPWDCSDTSVIPANLQIHRQKTASRESFRDLEFAHHGIGGTQFFSISGEPMFDDGSQFIGYRGVGRDLTKQRKADDERRALEAHLRESQKMEAIGVLAGGIARPRPASCRSCPSACPKLPRSCWPA
jgi:PAS domain S-box-containing protein